MIDRCVRFNRLVTGGALVQGVAQGEVQGIGCGLLILVHNIQGRHARVPNARLLASRYRLAGRLD